MDYASTRSARSSTCNEAAASPAPPYWDSLTLGSPRLTAPSPTCKPSAPHSPPSVATPRQPCKKDRTQSSARSSRTPLTGPDRRPVRLGPRVPATYAMPFRSITARRTARRSREHSRRTSGALRCRHGRRMGSGRVDAGRSSVRVGTGAVELAEGGGYSGRSHDNRLGRCPPTAGIGSSVHPSRPATYQRRTT